MYIVKSFKIVTYQALNNAIQSLLGLSPNTASAWCLSVTRTTFRVRQQGNYSIPTQADYNAYL
jgi:hypothetical protein